MLCKSYIFNFCQDKAKRYDSGGEAATMVADSELIEAVAPSD